MQAAQILLLVLLVPVAAASVYLGVLALLALLPSAAPPAGRRARRFVIVIPAHNEEASLPALLRSVAALDYPAQLVQTLVVADNCDDETAKVARRHGALVAERCDPSRHGKGFALAFGLAHLDDAWDAVVFVDADCTVSRNLLASFDARLAAGAQIIQAYYTMAPAESRTRLVRQLALELVNRVRPRAKRWLRASAGLKGSGMCFSRAVIHEIGWTSSGLAEDVEQHIRVLRHGLRVTLADEATVVGATPAALADASGQHRRWEAGRLAAAGRGAFPLLLSGFRHRSLARVDAAIDLLIPPVSLVGIAIPALLAAGAVVGSLPLTALASIAMASMMLYLLVGMIMLQPRMSEIVRCITAIPGYMLWKTFVYARAITARRPAWERTRRTEIDQSASSTAPTSRA